MEKKKGEKQRGKKSGKLSGLAAAADCGTQREGFSPQLCVHSPSSPPRTNLHKFNVVCTRLVFPLSALRRRRRRPLTLFGVFFSLLFPLRPRAGRPTDKTSSPVSSRFARGRGIPTSRPLVPPVRRLLRVSNDIILTGEGGEVGRGTPGHERSS